MVSQTLLTLPRQVRLVNVTLLGTAKIRLFAPFVSVSVTPFTIQFVVLFGNMNRPPPEETVA